MDFFLSSSFFLPFLFYWIGEELNANVRLQIAFRFRRQKVWESFCGIRKRVTPFEFRGCSVEFEIFCQVLMTLMYSLLFFFIPCYSITFSKMSINCLTLTLCLYVKILERIMSGKYFYMSMYSLSYMFGEILWQNVIRSISSMFSFIYFLFI